MTAHGPPKTLKRNGYGNELSESFQFLSTLAKEAGSNYSLRFTGRFYFYRRHIVSPLQATLACEDYSLAKSKCTPLSNQPREVF